MYDMTEDLFQDSDNDNDSIHGDILNCNDDRFIAVTSLTMIYIWTVKTIMKILQSMMLLMTLIIHLEAI